MSAWEVVVRSAERTGVLPALVEAIERGAAPDWLVRRGIRLLLAGRLREQAAAGPGAQAAFVNALRQSPIALHTATANAQHYELPPGFFERVLGPRLKYSGCLWPQAVTDLAGAEAAMLRLTCERAQIEDGMDVLDLGCGWGSLSLWIAEHYPRCRVLAVSNSRPQGELIATRAARLGAGRIDVTTADMNAFGPGTRRFDRVVSIEMFEHMRNYEALMGRIAAWLRPGGKLFVHIFCHQRYAYPYETEGADNWMGRYFFTGGIMPSRDLLLAFQDQLALEERWDVDGTHYARTSNAWLANLDAAREPVCALFRDVYGPAAVERWFVRWRLFFLACAELFAYRRGREWGVGHFRFVRAA